MNQMTIRFSREMRAQAVRLVLDNGDQHVFRLPSVLSISAKIGRGAQMPKGWVQKAEVDSGKRAGIPTEMAQRMKALERENRELRQAKEVFRKGEGLAVGSRAGPHPSRSLPPPGRSSAGAPALQLMRVSCSMPWNRPCMIGARPRASAGSP